MLGTNIGAYVTTRFAMKRTAFGTGIGNLADTKGDVIIQRSAHRPLHISGKLVVGVKCVLASGHTLAVQAEVGTDPDGGNGDYDTLPHQGANGVTVLEAEPVTITANNDGSAIYRTVEVDVNLIGAADYIRSLVRGTLSHSGSDSAEVFAVLVLGGGETVPPTEAAG